MANSCSQLMDFAHDEKDGTMSVVGSERLARLFRVNPQTLPLADGEKIKIKIKIPAW